MKTEYISGDSSQGTTVALVEHNGLSTVVRDNTGTGAVLKTTTDWTYYSFSITTLSTTRFINVQPRIFGHTGTATLQMTAWFDDIVLTRTSPIKLINPRDAVNNTIIYNGDFEYVPTGTIATTANSGWVDGTAAGTTNKGEFGWVLFNYTGSWAAKFDTSEKYSGTASIKISTTAVSSTVGVSNQEGTAASNQINKMPIAPNASYTLSFKMKTLVNSGLATTGAYLGVAGYKINGFSIAFGFTGTTSSTTVKTTTNWTNYRITFTTPSTAYYLRPELRIIGNDGTGTLIMDAWFDDITLTANNSYVKRKIINNLVENGDFESTPAFTAATTILSSWIDGTSSGGTLRQYNWGIIGKTGSGQAQFDNTQSYSGEYSLKVSTTGTGSLLRCTNTLTGKDFIDCAVLQSTSYTLSYFMKTIANSGSATSGAGLDAREWSGAGTVGATNIIGTPVAITTNWTKYSATFTTASTARFIQIRPQIIGNDGAATLIMDAWYDNIVLTKTTPQTRTDI
jgi:hypothetical protein